jgi:excisionase family DNA binding protein
MGTDNSELVEGGLLTIAQAEEFSGLSRSGLYSLMERGALAYVKLGKRRLIPRRALVALAERGLVVRESAGVHATP